MHGSCREKRKNRNVYLILLLSGNRRVRGDALRIGAGTRVALEPMISLNLHFIG